ncbi:hypothetical protein FGO68_gene2067 [Halteria grandinella]|uniref:Uncharacterized protein n=1 Tax=Halteria grandinella TaxID=5974 RepID=A0A8J8T5U6_HALGN|nr:hypothetical protein FGO68_gene2067 [Halteria grandinella]
MSEGKVQCISEGIQNYLLIGKICKQITILPSRIQIFNTLGDSLFPRLNIIFDCIYITFSIAGSLSFGCILNVLRSMDLFITLLIWCFSPSVSEKHFLQALHSSNLHSLLFTANCRRQRFNRSGITCLSNAWYALQIL